MSNEKNHNVTMPHHLLDEVFRTGENGGTYGQMFMILMLNVDNRILYAQWLRDRADAVGTKR